MNATGDEDLNRKAGLIVYRESETGLIGEWSHARFAGRRGLEHVPDARLDDLEGVFRVLIWNPGAPSSEPPMYDGKLQFIAEGDGFRLEWTGPARFEGIGWRLPGGLFAATFQMVMLGKPGA